jgi:thioredoxin reductase (NADPH)
VIAVVGGSDAAITEAMHLAQFASKVYIIHRRDKLRATEILQERAFAEPKIEILWDTVVDSIEGDDFVTRLKVKNVKTEAVTTLELAGVFVAIGYKPDTAYLKGIIPLDDAGQIITNEKMETEVPGVYAAGDIRLNSPRQVVTAAGDGAAAAIYAHRYLTE